MEFLFIINFTEWQSTIYGTKIETGKLYKELYWNPVIEVNCSFKELFLLEHDYGNWQNTASDQGLHCLQIV